MSWGGIKRDAADIAISKYVRKLNRWTCERCKRQMGEGGGEVSHFVGRRNQATRNFLDNLTCLCHSCHRYFTENPKEHTDWMKKKLGHQRFQALIVRSNLYHKKDRKLALIQAKLLMKTLKD